MLRTLQQTAPRTKRNNKFLLAAAALIIALPLTACDELLEVTDPDIITPESLENPAGLSALRGGAIGDFVRAYVGGGSGDGVTMFGGIMTDEWDHSGTFTTRQEAWVRGIERNNGTLNGIYRRLHVARRALEDAAAGLTAADPTDTRIGEVFMYAGFSYIAFGENWCGAVPFSSTDVDGAPESTTQIFNRAIDRFNSALASPISTDDGNAARVGMARAMLSLPMPDYAAAAGMVSGVPDAFVKFTEHSENSARERNSIFELNVTVERWSVADNKGGTGQFFRSSMDPRLPWVRTGGDDVGFDSETPQFDQQVYSSRLTSMSLASGIDARIIEAENELNNGTVANFLQLLADARAIDHPILGALTYAAGAPDVAGGFSLDLVDQGSSDGNLDLLVQERAYHFYSTGQQLGLLRRLIRNYGRTATQVFPQGVAGKGLSFESDVNLRITQEEDNNPNYDDSLCVPSQP